MMTVLAMPWSALAARDDARYVQGKSCSSTAVRPLTVPVPAVDAACLEIMQCKPFRLVLSVQWRNWPRLEYSTLCTGRESSQAPSWLPCILGMSLPQLCATHPQLSRRFAQLPLQICGVVLRPTLVCVAWWQINPELSPGSLSSLCVLAVFPKALGYWLPLLGFFFDVQQPMHQSNLLSQFFFQA